jgi:diguanylate cyclase (GGDEF)-like protein
MTTLPSDENDNENGTVERELTRRLAVSETAFLRASFIGYGLQALLLRGEVAAGMLLAWVGSVLLLDLVIGLLLRRLPRGLDAPGGPGATLAGLRVVLFLNGLAWGSVAVLPGIGRSPWIHALCLLILALVALFSVQSLSVNRACLRAFNVGLVLPLLVSNFLLPDDTGATLGIAAIGVLAMVHVHSELTRKLVVNDVRGRAALERMTGRLQQSNDELTLAMEQLHRIASCDPLTQCLNRRVFMEKLEYELARRTRYGTSFGVILLDLDRFKSINDRYGHDVGDRVLVAVASCLRGQLRPIDSLARWGGEEFLCLIAHVGEDDLLLKAEDLRLMLSQSPMVFTPEEITVTASLGAAIYQPGQTVLETIAQADRAMYRAKNGGRNRALVAA